jgi:superfamily II DNA/RNA helicase
VTQFATLGLDETIIQTLNDLKFTTPTPVQEATIPLALLGKDILASAQTGTGKTAAYGLPIIHHLMQNPDHSALVLAPTRELALQVHQELRRFLGFRSPLRSALLIGGEMIDKQFMQLKREPRLIVGTPGRVNDHLARHTLNLKTLNYLILDETDRMLDMGFSIQIDEILEHASSNRQTLLFSATLPANIQRLAGKYMRDPQRVSVDGPSAVAKNIDHRVFNVNDSDKPKHLLLELEKREGSVILFMKTKSSADQMADYLDEKGHSAEAIHGDLRQSKRDRVIKSFRGQKFRVLVATDVAARGLDIPHIEHVINYDLPQCAEDFIHRIGRTARAGAKGQALSFVSKKDGAKWRAIEQLLDPSKKSHGREERSFGDRKERSFGDRKNVRSFGDRKERTFGDRKERTFGDRKERTFGERKERTFGERKERSFGGKKEARPFGERKERSFGDKKDVRSFSDPSKKKFSKNKPTFSGSPSKKAS